MKRDGAITSILTIEFFLPYKITQREGSCKEMPFKQVEKERLLSSPEELPILVNKKLKGLTLFLRYILISLNTGLPCESELLLDPESV